MNRQELIKIATQKRVRIKPAQADQIIILVNQHGKDSEVVKSYVNKTIAPKFVLGCLEIISQFFPANIQLKEKETLLIDTLKNIKQHLDDILYMQPEDALKFIYEYFSTKEISLMIPYSVEKEEQQVIINYMDQRINFIKNEILDKKSEKQKIEEIFSSLVKLGLKNQEVQQKLKLQHQMIIQKNQIQCSSQISQKKTTKIQSRPSSQRKIKNSEQKKTKRQSKSKPQSFNLMEQKKIQRKSILISDGLEYPKISQNKSNQSNQPIKKQSTGQQSKICQKKQENLQKDKNLMSIQSPSIQASQKNNQQSETNINQSVSPKISNIKKPKIIPKESIILKQNKILEQKKELTNLQNKNQLQKDQTKIQQQNMQNTILSDNLDYSIDKFPNDKFIKNQRQTDEIIPNFFYQVNQKKQNNINTIKIIFIIISVSRLQNINIQILNKEKTPVITYKIPTEKIKTDLYEGKFYNCFQLPKVPNQYKINIVYYQYQQAQGTIQIVKQALRNLISKPQPTKRLIQCQIKPYLGKQFIMCWRNKIHLQGYQNNRAAFLPLFLWNNNKIQYTQKKNNNDSQQRQKIQDLFDWLNLFSQNIRQNIQLNQTIQNFPPLNQKMCRCLIYFLYFLYKDNLMFLLQNISYKFQFPLQYKLPQFISRYHKVLEYTYLKISYLMMINYLSKNAPHINYQRYDKYNKSAPQYLKKIIQLHSQKVKKEVIVKTAQKMPFFINSLVEDYIQNSELLSPIQYYNLKTKYFRPKLIYPNRSEYILQFLQTTLKKYKSFKREVNEQQLQIKVDQNGVRQIFVSQDYYNNRFFNLRTENFIRGIKILNELSQYQPSLFEKIKNSTTHFFCSSLEESLKNNFNQTLAEYVCPTNIIERQEKTIQKIINQKIKSKSLKPEQLKFMMLKYFLNWKDQKKIMNLPKKIFMGNLLVLMVKSCQNTLQLFQIFNNLKSMIHYDDHKLFNELIQQKIKNAKFTRQKTKDTLVKVSKFQQQLKEVYLQKYCQFLKSSINKKEKDKIIQQIQNQQIDDESQQLIIRQIYKKEELTPQQQQKQIFQAFLNQPKSLIGLKKISKNNFKQIIKNIEIKIVDKNLNEKQLEDIYKNKLEISNALQGNKTNIIAKVEQLKKQKDQFLKKLNNTKRILNFHDAGNFDFQLKKIEEVQQRVSRVLLKNSLLPVQMLQQVLQNSQQILSFINLEIWIKVNVINIQSLLKQRTQVINYIKQCVEQFKNQQLTFDDFVKVFSKQLQSVLAYCRQQKIQDQICQARKILNIQALKNLENCCQSLVFLKDKVENQQIDEFFQYFEIMDKLQQQLEINVHDMIKIVKETKKIFQFYKIDLLQEKDQITLIIKIISQSQEMFELIQENKLDQKIVSELKQYVNDSQNSILRLETVKQFQNVVRFWNLVMQSVSVQQVISKVTKQTNQKKWHLSECIKNSFTNLRIIEQKIKQAGNRQISFKYQIESILKLSTFIVRPLKSDVQFIIQVKNNDKQEEIDFKKIVNYKQKSLLLISDFEKDQSPMDEQTQRMINILKNYSELYQIINQMVKGCEKLITYGYDPQCLKFKANIKEEQFLQVVQIGESIKKTSQQWVYEIKTTYQQSHLLTHFLGPQLNQFIKRTIKKQYSPSLESIIGMSKDDFFELFGKVSTRQIISKVDSKMPLQKIKAIVKIFKNSQQDKRQMMEMQKTSSKQNQSNAIITLITCQKQEFYFYLFLDGKPHINQILYCQPETEPQQIEVFLHRAKLAPQKQHYVLAVHNLNTDQQLYFCDELNKFFVEQNAFAKLCFIDSSTSQKVYIHLCRKNLFNLKKQSLSDIQLKKKAQLIMKSVGQTTILQSIRSGLGKTFKAQSIASQKNKKLHYFPLAGNISFTSLYQRLQNVNIRENQIILLQIGHIENKQKLQIFLYQLIMFRCFYHRGYVFLPRNLEIFIELQNNSEQQSYNQYHILKILEKYNKHQVIQKFDVQNIKTPTNPKDIFIINYLLLLDNEKIHNQTIQYNQTLQIPKQWKQLLTKYFVNKLQDQSKQHIEITYSLYRRFMDMLFVALKTFSQSGYFDASIIAQSHQVLPHLQLDKVRHNFINICIENCLQFLKETLTTNEFDIQNKKDFRQKLTQFPLLIMPTHDFHSYKFIYMDSRQFPSCLKAYMLSQQHSYHKKLATSNNLTQISQLYDNEFSLNKMSPKDLQKEFYNILYHLSGNKRLLKSTVEQIKQAIPDLQKYSLTMDNFFKMCLIIQRSVCHVPIVIMGESGVGKTALISILVKSILNQELVIFNVHAGINEEQIKKWADEIIEKANELKQQKVLGEIKRKRMWVFFDEFNTTDELSYIKQMVIDRRFRGEALPENLMMIAACNPFRQKQMKNYIKAGIKKRSDNKIQLTNNLAFKVKPPPMSMIQFMWDYQQLRKLQVQSYVSKILQDMKNQNDSRQFNFLVQAIAQTHQYFKKQIEKSSVSLRDVSRFRQLYFWFEKYMPAYPMEKPLQQRFGSKLQLNANYRINRKIRATILSFCFCYSLRLASNKERSEYLSRIQKIMKFSQGLMNEVTKNEQIDYVNRLKNPTKKVALNLALRQNVFTTLVCLMNKIPILIIGNPGSSKSISVKMIASNFRGVNSSSQFCQQFPEINMIYFQGSQSCTSKGIQAVFEKAIRSQAQFSNKYNNMNCILFDQIGLAQKSVHNPLKVLHSKLQTNNKQIGFIGISNWQLDAAKMSRFLILARCDPEKQQLEQTSVLIYKSYFPDVQPIFQDYFSKLAQYYYKFLDEWNRNQNNRHGFFGLRDFYCYIKYICEEMKQPNNSPQNYLSKSIQTNFDGQRTSLLIFNQITEKQPILSLNPIQIVQQNLTQKQSRCLLLIVKGDALIPIINKSISINHPDKKPVCIYGSTFKKDQQSEEYNLEITSIIISHLARGTILTFKDINNSIQTSLYDLFNKSFYEIGDKKYCRIAVGANSNPKCYVHRDFNAIVYIDQDKIRETDLAFLNRFQKHYLELKNVVTNQQQKILQQIQRWIQQILSFRNPQSPLKQQNYIVNTCTQSIITLILKHRQRHDEDSRSLIRSIKKALLQNRTLDFQIALKRSKISELVKQQIQTISQEIIPYSQIKEQDMILFTYDQYLDMSEKYLLKNTMLIRISQIKCQKDLRKQLQSFVSSKQFKTLHIHVNYQKQQQHINSILYLASAIKEQAKCSKQIIIIIQLHRFSLIALGRQHINISYSHNYEQYFVEDLTQEGQTENLLRIDNFLQLFEKLEMPKNLNELMLSTLKRFKFTTEHIKNQKQNHPQIIQMYFFQCTKIFRHYFFQKRCNIFLINKLQNEKIDYQEVLHNKQDILKCSSVKQAIKSYLQEKIINLLCLFLSRIIENNFVYNFYPQNILQYYRDYKNIKLLKDFLRSRETYQKIFFNLFDQRVLEPQNNKPIYKKIKFNKGLQSNTIPINIPTIFPMIHHQINYIFLNNDQNKDKIQSFTNQLLDFSLSLQKKSESDYISNYEKALGMFLQKTKLNNYWIQINEVNSRLSIGYLFDVLNYICNESQINIKVVCKLLDVLLYLFNDLTLQDKIIMLLIDRNFWVRVFEVLIILFDQQDYNEIEEMIQDFFKSSQKKLKNEENGKIQLSQLIIGLANQIMKIINFRLKLTVENVSKHGVQKYYKFFKNLSFPIQKIRSNYQEYGLNIHQDFLVTTKLIDLFQKLSKGDTLTLIQQFVYENNAESICYQRQIYKYIRRLLMNINKKQYGKIEMLLNYLSFEIFYSWYLVSVQLDDPELKIVEVLQQFIQLSNQYAYFANNSVFFLQQLFSEFFQANSYEDKFQTLESLSREIKNILTKKIDMKNNFSVALGNFFNERVKANLENNFQDIIQENDQILQTYYQTFQRQMLQQREQNKIQQVLKLQFCKVYCLKYLLSFKKGSNIPVLSKIDKCLSNESSIAKHLRIYLIKNIFSEYKDIDMVRRQFIDIHRCQWIKYCQDLLQESNVQPCFIPPPIHLNSSLSRLIDQFRLSRYQNKQIFHDILKMSQNSPEDMYECLNFFLIDFYQRGAVPAEQNQLLKRQFLQRGDYQNQYRSIQKRVIFGYMESKISQNLIYYQGITSKQFFQEQFPLLTILNCMVSLKNNSCPFMEMFFNKQGQIPHNFQKHIESRFIIGGRENTIVTILETYIEKNDLTAGYYKCSTTCDYYYTVGGGKLGCQNVINIQQCPFCGGKIGGAVHGVLQRANQGAVQVQLTDLVAVCEKLREQKIIKIRKNQQHMIGYTKGNTIQQIKKENNGRINIMVQRILDYFVTSMWYVLGQMQLIDHKYLQQLLKLESQRQVFEQLHYAIGFYNQKIRETLGLENQQPQFTIWKLGMIKMLFKQIRDYNVNLSQNKRGNLSLRLCWHRDQCQKIFANNLIRYTGGREKEQLIINSRVLREAFKITKQDFVKEVGDIKTHLEEYPYIRMYKHTQVSKKPSYFNLFKQYQSVLPIQHPVLSYLHKNREDFKKADNFKIIYKFITKIMKCANFKITRENAKTISLRQFYNNYVNTENRDNQMKELKQFCSSWNYLVSSKYLLRFGCHENLGQLPKINLDDKLLLFLPDSKHTDNREGKKLLAFLKITASQYNQLCQGLEDSITKLRQVHHSNNNMPIISQTLLNPTQISEQSKMISFPQQQIKEYIDTYSCFSVEYGISVPHYALDEIESLIIKFFYGCKYLIDDHEEYATINFIGELVHCLTDIRSNSEQLKPQQEVNFRQTIFAYLFKKDNFQKDTFFKVVRNIQGSLQNIMIYYKNSKKTQKTIKEFVFQNKIKGLCNQIHQQPFSTLSMRFIVSLYQIIQMSTFKQIIHLLDPAYNSEDLTKEQRNKIIQVLKKMKNNNQRKSLPNYDDFRLAFYRFVSRSLLLMQRDPKLILIDFIINVQELWPIGTDLEQFTYNEELRDAFGISLTKIGKIIEHPKGSENDGIIPPPQIKRQVSGRKMIQYDKQSEQMRNHEKPKPEEYKNSKTSNNKRKRY